MKVILQVTKKRSKFGSVHLWKNNHFISIQLIQPKNVLLKISVLRFLIVHILN